MPQRKKKKGRMVKPFGDGGAANDGSHQSRQRLQKPASSKQHGLDLEQTMRKELSSLTLGTERTECLHGAAPALMLPHPCVKIFIPEFVQKINHFFLNNFRSDGRYHDESTRFSSGAKLNEIMNLVPRNLHPNYRDKDACDVAVTHLVSFGTSCCLDAEIKHEQSILSHDIDSLMARFFAQAVLYIEAFCIKAAAESTYQGYRAFLDYNFKLRDLWQGGEREITKFFHKRNVCTCLKGKCVQLRTQKKLGACYHCKQSYERKILMLCTQCKFFQYCSPECQRGHWPDHRDWCRQHRAKHTR